MTRREAHNRTIIRSWCVGFGGQASLHVTTRGSEREAASLRALLEREIRQLRMRLRPSRRVGEVEVAVTYSERPPAAIDTSDGREIVTVSFDCEVNRPGLLLRIAEAALRVDGANPNICYLEARVNDHWQAEKASNLPCSIAWTIDPGKNAERVSPFIESLRSAMAPLCSRLKPPEFWSSADFRLWEAKPDAGRVAGV